MRIAHRFGIGLTLLAVAAFLTLKVRSIAHDAPTSDLRGSAELPSVSLQFPELLEPGAKLQPSAKVTSLDGKRVRLVGFMAEMEEPMHGAFYLVPRPISLDESGGGTGDLPLDSILVIVPGAEGTIVPHVEGALEGTGILEVGNRADTDGRISNFRLRLDPDKRLVQTAAAVAAR